MTQRRQQMATQASRSTPVSKSLAQGLARAVLHAVAPAVLLAGAPVWAETPAAHEITPRPEEPGLAPIGFAVGLRDAAAEIAAAAALGATGVSLDLTWPQLEPAPGVYRLADLEGALNAARGMTVFINLRLIDTTRPLLPADIAEHSFADPVVSRRFAHLITALAPVLSQRVAYIALGGEADIYLSPNPQEADAFLTFLTRMRPALRSTAPQALLGVSVSLQGLDAGRTSIMRQLIGWSDAVMIAYQPLTPDFRLRPADETGATLRRVAALAPEKALVITDAAYATSPLAEGSAAGQARMLEQLLAQRRTIAFLGLAPRVDRPQADCAAIAAAHGAAGSQIYTDYWCSQGLVTLDGAQRPAYRLLAPGRPE
jgi:hypothetical protein